MDTSLEGLLAQLPADPKRADRATIKMGDAKPNLLPVTIGAAANLGWQWTSIRGDRVCFFYEGSVGNEVQFHID